MDAPRSKRKLRFIYYKMTRSKIEFATILATMRGQGEDPKQLAQDTTLRKLCYEIEKLEQEQEQESPPKVETAPEPPKETKKNKGPRPFWSWLLADSDDEDS
jgi:hypothetical protein